MSSHSFETQSHRATCHGQSADPGVPSENSKRRAIEFDVNLETKKKKPRVLDEISDNALAVPSFRKTPGAPKVKRTSDLPKPLSLPFQGTKLLASEALPKVPRVPPGFSPLASMQGVTAKPKKMSRPPGLPSPVPRRSGFLSANRASQASKSELGGLRLSHTTMNNNGSTLLKPTSFGQFDDPDLGARENTGSPKSLALANLLPAPCLSPCHYSSVEINEAPSMKPHTPTDSEAAVAVLWHMRQEFDFRQPWPDSFKLLKNFLTHRMESFSWLVKSWYDTSCSDPTKTANQNAAHATKRLLEQFQLQGCLTLAGPINHTAILTWDMTQVGTLCKAQNKTISLSPEGDAIGERSLSRPLSWRDQLKCYACLGEGCTLIVRKWKQAQDHMTACSMFPSIPGMGDLKQSRIKANELINQGKATNPFEKKVPTAASSPTVGTKQNVGTTVPITATLPQDGEQDITGDSDGFEDAMLVNKERFAMDGTIASLQQNENTMVVDNEPNSHSNEDFKLLEAPDGTHKDTSITLQKPNEVAGHGQESETPASADMDTTIVERHDAAFLDKENKMEQDVVQTDPPLEQTNDALDTTAKKILAPVSITSDAASLVKFLPDDLSQELLNRNALDQLSEVSLDLGRRPLAWVNGRRMFLGASPDRRVTTKDLQGIDQMIGGFHGGDGACLDAQLNRITALRGKQGNVIGVTMQVRKWVTGNVAMISDLIYSGKSILFLGAPGSGKTSVLREVSGLLSMVSNVVVIDKNNDIAGSGDVPHGSIGLARRLMVPDEQSKVIVDCVQNHSAQVMVIDELGTTSDARACSLCRESGVRLIAGARGRLGQIHQNALLRGLVLDESRLMGDPVAASSGRKLGGSPIFDVVVELLGDYDTFRIVMNPLETAAETSGLPSAEMRTRVSSDDNPMKAIVDSSNSDSGTTTDSDKGCTENTSV